jgi:hypothetical protein
VSVLTLYRCWLVSMRETVRWSSTRDNSPMECSILIALRSRVNPVLSCAQLTEVLGSPERKEAQSIGGWMYEGPSATYLGTMSLNSSIFSLPAGVSPMLTSIKTIGRCVEVIVV